MQRKTPIELKSYYGGVYYFLMKTRSKQAEQTTQTNKT